MKGPYSLKGKIRQLGDGSRTAIEIAEIVGCEKADVFRVLKVGSGQLKPCPREHVPRRPRIFENKSVWTTDRVSLLIALWNEGYSCSIIAERLGGISRNSVIGKVARLKLPARKTVTRHSPRNPFVAEQAPKIITVKQKPTFPVEPVRIKPERDIPLENRRGVADLLPDQCRWPIGTKNYYFCDCTRLPGQSYCLDHLLRSVKDAHRPAMIMKYGPPADTDGPQVGENSSRDLVTTVGD